MTKYYLESERRIRRVDHHHRRHRRRRRRGSVDGVVERVVVSELVAFVASVGVVVVIVGVRRYSQGAFESTREYEDCNCTGMYFEIDKNIDLNF